MIFDPPLREARLLRRYKRFLADVEYDDGTVETVHCPNPGAMLGIADPGLCCWVSRVDNPKRKLPATLELVREATGALVGANPNRANGLTDQALRSGALAPLAGGWSRLRREVAYAQRSRIDFLLEGGEAPIYVEVKNVHLSRRPGVAEFPDSVTARGAKHLRALAEMAATGARAVTLYVVQRDDCDRFALAADIDPTYAAAFAAARAAGVEACACACRITPEGIEIERMIAIIDAAAPDAGVGAPAS